MTKYNRKWLTKMEIFRGPDDLYLTRYVLCRTKWLSVFLHQFHTSDYPVPHDHPGNWLSIPLKTGYWEHLPDGTRLERKPLRPKFRTAEEFHWIELKPGTEGKVWSFFVFFRRRRDWGFLTEEGWVPYEEHNKSLGV